MSYQIRYRFHSLVVVLITFVMYIDSQTMTNGMKRQQTPVRRITIRQLVRMAYTEAKRDVLVQRRLDKIALDRNIDRPSEATSRKTCRFHMKIYGFNKDKAKLDVMSDAGNIVTRTTMKISQMTGMSIEQMKSNKALVREWNRALIRECPIKYPTCNKYDRYRTADGTCNNLRNPSLGAALTPQKRLMKSLHHDGFISPRMVGVGRDPLPSPRAVSNLIHKASVSYFDSDRTMMVFHYGQLVEHDVILTPTFTGHQDADIECCDTDPRFTVKRAACYPIFIPSKDDRFNTSCMNFVRVIPSVYPYCPMQTRTPINLQTSFFDCSMVYGSSKEEQRKLRLGYKGLLKMNRLGFPTESKEDICLKEQKGDYCFLVGDPRVTLVPGLAVFHILTLREHNRIALTLGKLNPHWNDERIFQETKKIMSAVLQHITYNGLLPMILSPIYMAKYGLRSRKRGYRNMYNPNIDPSALVSATTAALRFAHSNILNHQSQLDRSFRMYRQIPTFHLFDRPRFILEDNGRVSNSYARWLTSFPMAKSDNLVATAVRQFLFLDDDFHSFDLVSLNIQRGRDNAIPTYNQWRKFCGLRPALHFGDGHGGLIDFLPQTIKAFRNVYKHVDDIDLFSGGLSERPIPGGILGPTFSCIVALQHKNLKLGDRFWYERPDKNIGFTLSQLNEIKKYRLSKMMCNNFDFPKIQPNIFRLPDNIRNRRVPCNRLHGLNLRLWKERPSRTQFLVKRKIFRSKL